MTSVTERSFLEKRLIEKRLAACLLLAAALLGGASPAAAQYETEWQRSQLQGTKPSWFGGDDSYTERGIGYGIVDDGSGNAVERVFVVENGLGDKSPLNVRVLDAETGADVGTLSLDTLAANPNDRHLTLNDVEVSRDGVIFACNAPNNKFIDEGQAQPFRCYRWNSTAATPERVIVDQDIAAGNEWVGEQISVVGSAEGGTLTLYTASQNSKNVYRYALDESGDFTQTLITRSEEEGTNLDPAQGNIASVAPFTTGASKFYFSYAGDPPLLYDADGTFLGRVNPGVEVSSSGDVTYFMQGDLQFIASYRYGNNQHQASIVNVTQGPAGAETYGTTPTLGINNNIQGNGDLAIRDNDDGTFTLFVLATNNGLGAHTTNEAPLPVELTTFAATGDGDGTVLLRWATASETRNKGFEVQRNVEGTFEPIGFRDGAGTTTTTQQYRFRTDALPAGTHRFRLEQIDTDGNATFSPVVEATVTAPDAFALQGNAPNPVRDRTTIRYELATPSHVRVAVYDARGRRVALLADEQQGAGAQDVSFDASGLSSGVYVYRVETAGRTATGRMVVVQ
jgi:hypothetical protein